MKTEEFINQKDMYPVFQPVVSFSTGEVLGYEAFARFDEDAGNVSVEELFEQARKEGCVWALDKQCCKSAVKTARAFGLRKKLFININPLSMSEDYFKEDYMRNLLSKYAMNSEQVIIEITQKNRGGKDVLQSLVNYYRNEGYLIALDNVGAENCGIQEICALNPDFIKIDMSIVRNINGDKVRQSMVKSLSEFCKNTGSKLIATGIETKEELNVLLSLDVSFGQGFFIGAPEKQFTKTGTIPYAFISSYQQNRRLLAAQKENMEKKSVPKRSSQSKKAADARVRSERADSSEKKICIGDFCIPGITLFPETPVTDVLQLFQVNTECSLAVIVDMSKKVVGIVTRRNFLDLFGSQYGFSLHMRKVISELMEKTFLSVDENEAVTEVSKKAMARDDTTRYSPVVVESNGMYKGLVTIKTLIDTIVNIEVADKTQEIMYKNRILQKQQQLQKRDMKMAELVQKSFYRQSPPETKLWDCAFYFRPMASVSGDVYDFYMDKKAGELKGISLFDVSGHGVASGLVGILSKYLAKQVFSSCKDKALDALLKNFNKVLTDAKGLVENYLTGLFLRIDGGKIEYVNAGHPDVLVRRPADRAVHALGGGSDDFRGSFIGIDGLPEDFKVVEETLEKDSYILLFTDCLIESRNLMGFEMGERTLSEVFSKATGKTAKSVLSYILEAFSCFTEGIPLKDDLTVIVLHYKNGAA